MNIRFLTIILAITALPAAAQVSSDFSTKVDEMFQPWDSQEMPGCAIGLSQNGNTVFERAYGMADLEWGIPNTPSTIFEGGSLAKQFTAAAVVLLALDEEINLGDDIRLYLPEVPDYGQTITIRHLLNHTSGLRDWGSVAALSGWSRGRRAHTHADVLDIISRQSALNYEPGREYSYTNSGYNLLAILVSRVADMSFAEFSERRLFEPLGLENTQWRDDYRRIVKGRSSAYSVNLNGEVTINRPVEDVHGNGGILTTVGDLLRWNQALAEERLGSSFTELMEQRGTLNNGAEINYASGLIHGNLENLEMISHSGATAGYRATTGRVPEARVAWALLCNASNGTNAQTALGPVRLFLEEQQLLKDLPAAEGIQLSEEQLQNFTGQYRERYSGRTMSLRIDDGDLKYGTRSMIPLSATEFTLGASGPNVQFDFNQDSGRPQFVVNGWQTSGQIWEQVDPWEPSVKELAEFVGEYYSDEAETTYGIVLEDDELKLHRRPDTVLNMSSRYQDGFRSGAIVLRFHRDSSGVVSELSVGIPRVYDMRFSKVQD